MNAELKRVWIAVTVLLGLTLLVAAVAQDDSIFFDSRAVTYDVSDLVRSDANVAAAYPSLTALLDEVYAGLGDTGGMCRLEAGSSFHSCGSWFDHRAIRSALADIREANGDR